MSEGEQVGPGGFSELSHLKHRGKKQQEVCNTGALAELISRGLSSGPKKTYEYSVAWIHKSLVQ